MFTWNWTLFIYIYKSECSWIWKKCLNQNHKSRNLKIWAQTCTWKTSKNFLKCENQDEMFFQKGKKWISLLVSSIVECLIELQRTIGFSFFNISLSKMYPFILRIKEMSILIVVWKTLKNHWFSQMNKQ
jgi:hypothetical protein